MDTVLILLAIIFGCGGSGVGIAWLNDKRHVAKAKRLAGAAPSTTPRQVLELRFANGEIDEVEFSRRMRLLTYGPPLELDH